MKRGDMMQFERLLFLTIIFLVLVQSICFGKYSGGAGEPNDPYLIATAEDLNDIGNHVEDFNKCFLMVADINLADYTGTQFNIIGDFTGVFDGNNHKVCNFTWSSSGIYEIGLFGRLGGQIKNLGLESIDVNGGTGWYVGGLVGKNSYEGMITNCYSIGDVLGTGGYVGRLVGYNGGTVSNCYSAGSVSGTGVYVGGLVGYNPGLINNCYSTGTVGGNDRIGGLVGYNAGKITNCYYTGSVTGNYIVGGLVGDNDLLGQISNSYATGSVTGDYLTGGLVGYNYYEIKNCYSSGSVSGSGAVGGLVGLNHNRVLNSYATGSVSGYDTVGGLVGANAQRMHSIPKITNCYSTGDVNGTGYVGGLLGYNSYGEILASFWDVNTSGQSTSAGGEGKTTAEMKTESTFTDAGWDFIDIWDIGENQTYPFLQVYQAGDINHDDIVNFYDLAILANHWLQGTE